MTQCQRILTHLDRFGEDFWVARYSIDLEQQLFDAIAERIREKNNHASNEIINELTAKIANFRTRVERIKGVIA